MEERKTASKQDREWDSFYGVSSSHFLFSLVRFSFSLLCYKEKRNEQTQRQIYGIPEGLARLLVLQLRCNPINPGKLR